LRDKTWQKYEFGFEALGTNVARTSAILACGGYPNFTRGNGIDNALVIKLCLNSNVAFSSKCAWRWRVYESSHGWSVSMNDFASSCKEFMRFLNTDPVIRKSAKENPTEWRELKQVLVRNEWQTYFGRWKDIYKPRLSRFEWVRAAFAMPIIPQYYRKVASVFREEVKLKTKKLFGISAPAAKKVAYFERDA
jgi:hypothetical protein